jgi:thiol-disulfide isomerase/thioredoxin/outer membrane lipoprotein-sorting protein
MRLIVLAALTLSSLCAQQFPEGAALVRQSESAQKKLRSFRFQDESTTRTLLEGHTLNDKSEISMAMLSPGKARFELKSQDDDLLAVSNGESTWIYSAGWHEYTRRSAVSGPDEIMAELGVDDMMPHFGDVPITAKTIGEERVTIDGQTYDCWVVEMHVAPMDLPGKGGGKVTDGVMTHWFDKKLGIDLQSTFSSKLLIPGGPTVEMHQKTQRKTMQIDGPIDDSLFVFTPPAGAKEVQKLSMFGGQRSALPDLVGKAAPDFTVETVDGKPYSLSALKGKAVLLDFWTTWCGPCRNAMPSVEHVAQDYKEGLVVLAVNAGEERDAVQAFLKKTPMAYPAVLSGETGILKDYQVNAYPTFVLIGSDGKIAAYEMGFSGDEMLRGMLEKAGLKAK